MRIVHSVTNPFKPKFTNEPAKRNKLCQRIALIPVGLGVCATVGIAFSALPLAATGAAALITIIAYKVFSFIRTIDKAGRLHKAAEEGQVMMTKLLLFLGATPNKRSGHGNTPLHMACFRADNPNSDNHIKVMKILTEAGSNLNIPGNGGRSPLHYALDARHVDRVDLLVDQGAFINLRSTSSGTRSPWGEAIYRQSVKNHSKQASDPRSYSELKEAEKQIFKILEEKGKTYVQL